MARARLKMMLDNMAFSLRKYYPIITFKL